MIENHITKGGTQYVGYEYKTISVDGKNLLMILDCYANFGWFPENTLKTEQPIGLAKVTLKRDRKIIKKAELTRLQQHFEACVEQVQAMDKTKNRQR